MVRESKSFILPILPCLAPKVLVPNEHHVLNDLPLYEVVCVADAKARQDWLEQRKKKHHDRTLRQAPSASRPTSNSTPKKKKPSTQPAQKALTPLSASPSPLSTSPSHSLSFSSASLSSFAASTESDSAIDLSFTRTEPEMEVEPVVPPIIYEEEGNENMAANLRVGFKERQRKRLFESITIISPHAKKPYMKILYPNHCFSHCIGAKAFDHYCRCQPSVGREAFLCWKSHSPRAREAFHWSDVTQR